jgi:DNA-binding response OmpR family regulator
MSELRDIERYAGQNRTVVILEENPDVIRSLETDLSSLGYHFVRAQFPVMRVPDITNLMPEAVILGLTEWDDNRLSACEMLLQQGVLSENIPVIALFTENTMRKVPLEFVFADTIIYPYQLNEFKFRLNSKIYQYRRKAGSDIITIDDISISLEGYEVRFKGEPVALTFKEYELLRHLIINRGRVCTRDSLLSSIWGFDYYGGTRTVDVHIRRLRYKLGDVDETYIRTVRGVGYTFRSKI